MTPKEMIARTIYERFNPKGSFDKLPRKYQGQYLRDADAIIDALASMEVTEGMRSAYSDITCELIDPYGWRAMVGAMRDE